MDFLICQQVLRLVKTDCTDFNLQSFAMQGVVSMQFWMKSTEEKTSVCFDPWLLQLLGRAGFPENKSITIRLKLTFLSVKNK